MAETPDNADTPYSIVLFDADAPDRRLELDDLDIAGLSRNQLLWVDIACGDAPLIEDIGRRLGLDAHITELVQRANGTPSLENHGDCFTVHCVAVEHLGKLEYAGLLLNLAVCGNLVLSVHGQPIAFIDELRKRESSGRSDIGALSAESFAASLLDWQLTTYFEAVSDFEMAVERLEVGILAGGSHQLTELHGLRRAASRLRRMLAPHRRLFAGMARPDFRPRADGEANAHFQTLEAHYERAMDMVENARDLVVGSFELFTSETAWRTNRTMQTLTFFTVVLGIVAVMAGVFGMNFESPMFHAREGFEWSVIGMLGFVVIATLTARWRKWL